MTYETLELTVRNHVAHLTLNRPKALNAMSVPMMKELSDVAIRCDEDPDVRAVLISGRGHAFCAGGDLTTFAEAGDRLSGLIKEGTMYLHAAISRFARADAPVVVAVNGVAAGAGLSLVCAGDLVIAADDAKFTMAYTRAGLVPDGSSTFYLPRVVGLRRAQELVLTNRLLSASEALDWGLVSRIVPSGELAAESVKLAETLASGPTRAFGAARRLLLVSMGDRLESQMELEARAIAEAGAAPDGQEGIRAFLGKRPPAFSGR